MQSEKKQSPNWAEHCTASEKIDRYPFDEGFPSGHTFDVAAWKSYNPLAINKLNNE